MSYEQNREAEILKDKIELRKLTATSVKWSVIGSFLLLIVVVLFMWGCPQYRVWQQGLEGQAELKRAEQNRQVVIQEALSKKEAAVNLAVADTIRAHGVARSNSIIGESLKNNEAYLHWLWIDNIEKNPNAVIYIPTEANLPIMEAGRFRQNIDKPKIP